ncbi:MAG: UbiA family prenyltransferase [Candidatus Thorarchaeota archaeon]
MLNENPIPSYGRTKDYLDLFRFSLGILSVIAVLAAGFIVYVMRGNSPNFLDFMFENGVLPLDGLILGVIATLLLASAIESINDYFDVETDIANRRYDRPIARGAFTPRYVKNLSIAFFVLSTVIISFLVLVYNVTIALLGFTIIFIIVGVFYNLGLKETGFIGNMWVSVGYVSPLFTGFFLLSPTEDFILFACGLMLGVTFFLATGREIVKDIQDLAGDKSVNLKSLPVRIGPVRAGWIASGLFLIAIICATLVGLLVYENVVFWSLLVILTLILGLTSYTILTEKELGGKKARKYTRWSLWTAMGAFFLGAFFIP